MFRGGEHPPNSIIVNANFSDNPWLSKESKAQMEWDKRRDPDKYQHIWLGGYERNSEARVFRNWKIGEIDIPEGARPYFGADWAFSVDQTVRCWIFDRTVYVDREVYKVGCDIDKTPALFEKVQDERTPKIRDWPIRGDSARPETISYMNKQGFTISPAKKGPGSVEDGVEFLMSHDIIVHPDCQHCVDELSLYSYRQDKLPGEILPLLGDKKNHVIDALRYAVENLSRGYQRDLPIAAPIIIAGDSPSQWWGNI